ncbi:MAG: Gfo/Idh/MocA family oxidoreductase [Planctomycetes bacterium]|nr:Gfo/Idh/MocA family oxidoreductase [Planctomycetota bacterium]
MKEKMESRKISRRRFLKTSANAASLAALSVGMQTKLYAAGSDIIRIGLVGCGGRGAGAVVSALSVNRNAKLTAMAEAFGDRLQNTRKSLKNRMKDQVAVDDDHCFTGFDGYRKLIASGIDVAILVSPPHFRPIHAEACINAGVHVFAEKPMAVDAPGVRRILAAGKKARRKNLSFVSGFETRYGGNSRKAMSRLHNGAIGKIISIEGIYNIGYLWHRGRQPDWTEMEFQLRNWYYFTWLSGDHIVEQHVHQMDMASWIMLEEPPLHAWGMGGRQVRTDPKYGDIFDHHTVVYEYADGVRFYAFCRQQANCFNRVSFMVQGSKGRMTGWGRYIIEGETSWDSGRQREHPELTTFKEMFAGMRAGKPINDSVAMARSTMLAILGRMATHSGQGITWEQALQSKKVLAPKRYTWDAVPPVLPGQDGKYPHPIPGKTKVL